MGSKEIVGYTTSYDNNSATTNGNPNGRMGYYFSNTFLCNYYDLNAGIVYKEARVKITYWRDS